MQAFVTFISTVLALIAGWVAGIGSFIWGIWQIILLCKGTIALTFWAVAKAAVLILGCGLIGWAVGLLVFAIGALIGLLFGCSVSR